MHIAAIFGRLETAKLLVKLGLNVNQLDKIGNSPLFYAIKHRNSEIALFLYNSGAKILTPQDNLEKLIMKYIFFNHYKKCWLFWKITKITNFRPMWR